jgi:hypothetical protein
MMIYLVILRDGTPVHAFQSETLALHYRQILLDQGEKIVGLMTIPYT